VTKHRFIGIALLLLFGSLVSGTANADSWDFVYGEDPSNGATISAYTAVKADPRGGFFVAGYFFDSFEGISTPGLWTKFVQHRSDSGLVDWTIPYKSYSGASVIADPAEPPELLVDGAGTAYFFFFDLTCMCTRNVSITRTGLMTQDSGVAFPQECGSVADRQSGLIQVCGTTLKKVDSTFSVQWSLELGDRTGPIALGAGQSVWVVTNVNSDNLDTDPSLVPSAYRPYVGLTRYSTTDGRRIVSIKHFGIMAFDVYAAGERNIWVHTKTSSSAREKISVFRSSDGFKLGDTDSRLNLYGPSWQGGLDNLETLQRVDQNYQLTPAGSQPINLWVYDRWRFPRWNNCFSSCLVPNTADVNRNAGVFTNDGRRLAIFSKNRVWVFELSGEDVPQLSSLIVRQDFASNINAMDMDDFGNLYVVGSTLSTTVVSQVSSERRPQSSFAGIRGFVSKNPGGDLGLTVLPRTPLRFKVTGSNGVPSSGVGAVSMNVTVTTPRGEGFITAYPCDSRPDASNLNYVLNQTVPNAVIAPVSAAGEVCFYTYAETHLIADVNGYFPSGSGFVSNIPARVIDTRVGAAQGLRTVSKTKVGNGTELRVQFTNLSGGITPASGVGAVSLNVTVTGSQAPNEGGFVTVYPCGDRPDASNLNFRSGQTVPNAVITPVSANGDVCFYVFGSTDLIADINGYFPGGAGFVATEPVRVADTRPGAAQGLRTVTKQRIGGNTTLQLQLTNLPGGITPSSGIGAVSLNVTAVNTTANQFGGYVTTYPCGTIPDVSSLNFVSNQIVPNAVIAPLSANGTICFYAYGQTDLIVDLNGYFPTGAGFVPVNPKRLFDTR